MRLLRAFSVSDLRVRLETAWLNLLALFRALDRMQLRPTEIPQTPDTSIV